MFEDLHALKRMQTSIVYFMFNRGKGEASCSKAATRFSHVCAQGSMCPHSNLTFKLGAQSQMREPLMTRQAVRVLPTAARVQHSHGETVPQKPGSILADTQGNKTIPIQLKSAINYTLWIHAIHVSTASWTVFSFTTC